MSCIKSNNAYFLPDYLPKVKSILTYVHLFLQEFRDLVSEICFNFYLQMCFAFSDAMEYLAKFYSSSISQLNVYEILPSLLQKLGKTTENLSASDFIANGESFVKNTIGNDRVEKILKTVKTPDFVNNVMVCGGLGIIGFLFGGLNGFLVGLILAGLILRGLSLCPTGKLKKYSMFCK